MAPLQEVAKTWCLKARRFIPSMFFEKASSSIASTAVPSSYITAGGATTRPSARVPMRMQSGSPIAQGTGNGDGIGRGTGSQWQSFVIVNARSPRQQLVPCRLRTHHRMTSGKVSVPSFVLHSGQSVRMRFL